MQSYCSFRIKRVELTQSEKYGFLNRGEAFFICVN